MENKEPHKQAEELKSPKLPTNEKNFQAVQLLACVKIMQALGIEPGDIFQESD